MIASNSKHLQTFRIQGQWLVGHKQKICKNKRKKFGGLGVVKNSNICSIVW